MGKDTYGITVARSEHSTKADACIHNSFRRFPFSGEFATLPFVSFLQEKLFCGQTEQIFGVLSHSTPERPNYSTGPRLLSAGLGGLQ